MNILSFDIEEWFVEKTIRGDRAAKYEEYDRYLQVILDKLEERNIKATFFCVGQMGIMFPEVIKKIAARNHEIGCHSHNHKWLNQMSREEALVDTRMAVDALEQCVGQKVISYRAPAFTIGKNNKWMLDILSECGIQRDASIFPIARDYGGFDTFGQAVPSIVETGNSTIKEYPIPVAHVLGKSLAYSGGGYFRFFPLWFVKKEMKQVDYSMAYFHIEDLLPEKIKMRSRREYEDYFKEKGTFTNRYKRYLKGNIGKAGSFDKMIKLIDTIDFVNLNQADQLINWNSVPVVKLEMNDKQ